MNLELRLNTEDSCSHKLHFATPQQKITLASHIKEVGLEAILKIFSKIKPITEEQINNLVRRCENVESEDKGDLISQFRKMGADDKSLEVITFLKQQMPFAAHMLPGVSIASIRVGPQDHLLLDEDKKNLPSKFYRDLIQLHIESYNKHLYAFYTRNGDITEETEIMIVPE
jgi:hypothetical protein